MPESRQKRKYTSSKVGMSMRDYGAHAGISHVAVIKAKSLGMIATYPDGSINAIESDRLRSKHTNPAQRSNAARFEQKEIPAPAAAAVHETLKEHGLTDDRAPPSSQVTFASARTANEVLKAQERRIKLQQLKGDVVDRSRATALVFRLAREERDSWVGWPARVAAVMAAEIGVDPHTMQTTLDQHVREHLEHLAALKIEFR